jgi:hypothetical protein
MMQTSASYRGCFTLGDSHKIVVKHQSYGQREGNIHSKHEVITRRKSGRGQ